MRRTFPLAMMSLVVLVFSGVAMAADALPKQIKGLALAKGYTHQPLQGIDSIVGKIVGENGVTISYEIGRIPQPGGFRLGGDFSDAAARVPEAQRQWYKEQPAGDETVHVAYTKTGTLVVTFPDRGANFSAAVKEPEQVAEILLMLMSIPAGDA